MEEVELNEAIDNLTLKEKKVPLTPNSQISTCPNTPSAQNSDIYDVINEEEVKGVNEEEAKEFIEPLSELSRDQISLFFYKHHEMTLDLSL